MPSLTVEFQGTISVLRLFGSPLVLRIRRQESVLCLLSLVIKVLTSFQKFTFSIPLFCNYILDYQYCNNSYTLGKVYFPKDFVVIIVNMVTNYGRDEFCCYSSALQEQFYGS